MSHYECDHCGRTTGKETGDASIIWCGKCIDDNWEAIQALGLSGGPYRKAIDWSFTYPDNIEKLRSIPKKTPTIASQEVPAVAPIATPPVAPSPEPAMDFDAYNRTLPGGRKLPWY